MGIPITVARMITNFNTKLTVRSHGKVSREVNKFVMDYHWRVHIPQHFKPGAGRRYGYRRRTSIISIGWMRKSKPLLYASITKLSYDGKPSSRARYTHVKKVLGRGPLVWSGETKLRTERKAFRAITATQKRGRLTITTPPWLTSRIRRTDGQPVRQMQMQALERQAELEVMTEAELNTLGRQYRDEYLAIQTNPTHRHHGLVVMRTRKRRI